MSILHSHFREHVVRPVLSRLGKIRAALDSRAAEELLVGTAAHESRLGHWLAQEPGPARGIYQMEPRTFSDLMRWLGEPSRQDLMVGVIEWAAQGVPLGAQIAGNLYFATALARLEYWRKPFVMPADAGDVAALAAIWKKWWNTDLGKGTVEQFLRHHRELARG